MKIIVDKRFRQWYPMKAVSEAVKNWKRKQGWILKRKETVSSLSPEAEKQRRQQRAGLLEETADKDKKVVDRKE